MHERLGKMRKMGTHLFSQKHLFLIKNRCVPIFICICLGILLCCGCLPQRGKRVCINNACVSVEITNTDLLREQGLMYRNRLPQGRGMFFIFEEDGVYNFWMKNMRFALDIIWINKDHDVVDIRDNVPPCTESCPSLVPKTQARYVLEVNSGFVRKNNIKIGDKAVF